MTRKLFARAYAALYCALLLGCESIAGLDGKEPWDVPGGDAGSAASGGVNTGGTSGSAARGGASGSVGEPVAGRGGSAGDTVAGNGGVSGQAGTVAQGGGGAGATAGAGGSGGTGEVIPEPTHAPQVDFEDETEAWFVDDAAAGTITHHSTLSHAYYGSRSVRLDVTANGEGTLITGITAAELWTIDPADHVWFHVWIPEGAPLDAIQVFVLEGASSGYRWTGAWLGSIDMKYDQWNTIMITARANSTTVVRAGVELHFSTAWTGSIYVDAIRWD